MKFRSLCAMFCLLIWGGTHVLQLGHLFAHHILPGGNHHHCAHHAHTDAPKEDFEGGMDQAEPECLLCDWNWTPALGVVPPSVRSALAGLGILKTLGLVESGYASAPDFDGWQRRGPPVQVCA
jgi:hypothetical protein